MVYDVNLIATLLLGWTAMCQGKMMDNADEPKSVIKEYKAGRILEDNTASSNTIDNNTCCNRKDSCLTTNLTSNCSKSLGLKTTPRRHTRSPIMVPVDYSKIDLKKVVDYSKIDLKEVEEFIDIDKEPSELQDLIGAVKPPEDAWEFHKDFRNDYNRTRQRNTDHPGGYHSTPSEDISVEPPEDAWEFHKDFRNDHNRTRQRNTEHPRGYHSTPSENISVEPPEDAWEFHKDFRNDYNRTKQRNIKHPRGYYSTPSEKINFTGGYAVKEKDDNESDDVEDKVEKWREDPVMYDMTGDGSDQDYTKEDAGEENVENGEVKGLKGGEDDDDGSGGRVEEEGEGEGDGEEEEGEVDLSDQFEDDKLEPPEFRDKFYKTKPYYKYLKYPKDVIAAASTENEKTPDENVQKPNDDVKNVTVSYKPLNESRDVGFYRSVPLQQPSPYNRYSQPPYRPYNERPYNERPYNDRPYNERPYNDRPYNDGGGMYVFRKRSPYDRKNRKIIIVNSPVPRKPKFIIRSSNCNGCMMPRNVVRKVGMPMYYYPMSKVPPSRFKHTVHPPKYHNRPAYGSQPFPGDPRYLSGDFREGSWSSGDFRGPGDGRYISSGDSRGTGDGRYMNPGDFRGPGDFRTSGDNRILSPGVSPLGDPKSQVTPNLTEPRKDLQTRHQRHHPNFVTEEADPNSGRKEIHIMRDTPGGYDDTVIYHERKYVPTDLEISASEPYRPDPFREVEDEYSERVERLNDLIDRETDKTSREIDLEYDYWDNN